MLDKPNIFAVNDVPFIDGSFEITKVVNCVGSNPELIITVETLSKNLSIEVSFELVEGYRALDERDLGTFNQAMPKGWCYLITNGGWFELESLRDDFISKHLEPTTEYMIFTDMLCLNVLTNKEPSFNVIKSL